MGAGAHVSVPLTNCPYDQAARMGQRRRETSPRTASRRGFFMVRAGHGSADLTSRETVIRPNRPVSLHGLAGNGIMMLLIFALAIICGASVFFCEPLQNAREGAHRTLDQQIGRRWKRAVNERAKRAVLPSVTNRRSGDDGPAKTNARQT